MAKLTLISSSDILELLNIDFTDEDMVTLLSFSVTTEIENYCRRVLIARSLREYRDGNRASIIELKEWPVTDFATLEVRRGREFTPIDPQLFSVCPEPGTVLTPCQVELTEGLLFPLGNNNILIRYGAGYAPDQVPDDLKTAFCEILEWMLKRLKARQIGVHALARAKNQTGPLLYDPNIPDHARQILESYRRKRY